MATNRFGYWIDVTDRASATEAVRMAGLPVLLIGASFLLNALVASQSGATFAGSAAGLSLAGLVIITIAFAIRGGRAGLVPVETGLSALVLAVSIVLNPTILVIVPLLALLLCISGLRGWLWLRRNPR